MGTGLWAPHRSPRTRQLTAAPMLGSTLTRLWAGGGDSALRNYRLPRIGGRLSEEVAQEGHKYRLGEGERGRAGAGQSRGGAAPLLRATRVTPSGSHRRAPAKGGEGNTVRTGGRGAPEDRPQQESGGGSTGQAWGQ